MSKRYVVKLTAEERTELGELVRKNKAASWKLDRARALLKCDQGPHGPEWPDARIVEAFGGTTRSLENWRKQAVERGPLSLLERKPQAIRAATLGGEQEAQLTKLACSQPPAGQARWTLRLLSRRAVESLLTSREGELVLGLLSTKGVIGLLVSRESLPAFNEKFPAGPTKALLGKRVEATGMILEDKGRLHVQVDDPSRIKIIDVPAGTTDKADQKE